MMGDQRGQALAIVLVVMAVLFALAGAITIGTSVLLRQQGGPWNASTDDLAGQSAVTDAVAQVAGNQPPKCGLTTEEGFPETSQPPTPLSITFPNVNTDVSSLAYCNRLDQVSASLPSSFYLIPAWASSSCTDLPVPTSSQRSWIFFNARWMASGGYAFVDGNTTMGTCTANPPTPKPGTDPCSSTPVQPSCVRCGQVIGPSKQPQVAQVALNCDLRGTGNLYLHVYNPAHSPARAFSVTQDQSGGVVYLVAANTRVSSAAAYEEAVLFVGPGGSPNRLLYEAPLP